MLETLCFIGYVSNMTTGLSTMLTAGEKRDLLGIARDAIGCALHHRSVESRIVSEDALLQPCGAFVTLRSNQQLRGCIGYIESTRPLADTVAEVAVKAAMEDPRFLPLTLTEFEHVDIEISILSPLHRISRIEEIEIGTHGLLLEQGVRRGLLLPQVATEYGWDRLTFLEAVTKKAGLAKSAWRDADAKLFVFRAEIVEEADCLEGGRSA
jgi:AmmeMemoRadiSam system protein A